jgi:hypothetical protein
MNARRYKFTTRGNYRATQYNAGEDSIRSKDEALRSPPDFKKRDGCSIV